MTMKIRTLHGLVLVVAFFALGAAAAAQDLRMVTAAADQDRGAVLALLDEGIDVNTARPDGVTALLWAAHWDDVELAERLLDAGADVNAADDHGVTALERAAENASIAMVETLLAGGADVDAAQTSGLTPLMTAARTGSVGVVRRLIAGGADADAVVTATGSTALMWAVSERHPEVVRLLLAAGAATLKGFTPLMYAARNGDVATAATLIAAGSDVNEPSADGTHVLPFSIVSGQDAFALYLLEQGADPNGEMGGVSALHAAAGNVSPWLLEWYRRHGRNRLYAGLGGARLGAARRLALVEALLERGADPNGRITAWAMIM
ncbi:MAG: ankyrin repeat domain-containing protein, partial [Acidobacteria bacterium]|nr:ankyrin repeat domain-containing protein [Acidobacteriota bacterium]